MKTHEFGIGMEGREVFWNIGVPAFELILFAVPFIDLAILT